MIEMVLKVVKDLLKSVLQCYEQTIIYLLYKISTLDQDHYQIYFNTMNYRYTINLKCNKSVVNEIHDLCRDIYKKRTPNMNEPVNQLGHPILGSAVIWLQKMLSFCPQKYAGFQAVEKKNLFFFWQERKR